MALLWLEASRTFDIITGNCRVAWTQRYKMDLCHRPGHINPTPHLAYYHKALQESLHAEPHSSVQTRPLASSHPDAWILRTGLLRHIRSHILVGVGIHVHPYNYPLQWPTLAVYTQYGKDMFLNQIYLHLNTGRYIIHVPFLPKYNFDFLWSFPNNLNLKHFRQIW
jgi:hypothetical protein